MMIFKKGFTANKVEVHYSQVKNLTSTTGVEVCIKYIFFYNDIKLLTYNITSANEESILEELENNDIDMTDRDVVMVVSESTLLYEKEVNIEKITIEDLGKTYKVTFYDDNAVVLVSHVCKFKLASIIKQLH